MAITKVAKGYFYVRERGIKYNFMFNPSDIKESHGANFPHELPAGASHPVYNYASGGERLLKFTLQLDGDRGRSDKRPKASIGPDRIDTFTASNGGSLYTVNSTTTYAASDLTSGGNTSLNINDEVKLLMSLKMPTRYGVGVKDVYPHIVLFTLGEHYKAVPVVVKKADPTYTMWTPKMEPMRASVEMELGVVVNAYQTASEFAPSALESAGEGIAQGIGSAINFGINSVNDLFGRRDG